jgi:hypothetical protein
MTPVEALVGATEFTILTSKANERMPVATSKKVASDDDIERFFTFLPYQKI